MKGKIISINIDNDNISKGIQICWMSSLGWKTSIIENIEKTTTTIWVKYSPLKIGVIPVGHDFAKSLIVEYQDNGTKKLPLLLSQWELAIEYELIDVDTDVGFEIVEQSTYNYAKIIQIKKEKTIRTEEDWLRLIDLALSWGYHAAKDEQNGIPSFGYGSRFYKRYLKKNL